MSRDLAMNGGLRAYFGHHRCASQWANNIVKGVCRELQLSPVIFNGPRQFNDDLGSAVAASRADVLCYTNASQTHVDTLENYRGFHMVRDPRDVVVSAYFSHLYSHRLDAWLIPHRARLQAVDKSDGLLLELEHRHRQFENMLNWNYANPNVLEVTMEAAIADPGTWWRRILDFIGLPVGGSDLAARRSFSEPAFDRILAQASFAANSAGRQPGQEDVHRHYRKGVPGDWRNHFEAVHIDYFKAHYNDLLLRLGYEARADW